MRGLKVTSGGNVYDINKIKLSQYAFGRSSTLTEFYADGIISFGGSVFLNSSVKNVEVGGTFDSCGYFDFNCGLTNLVINSKDFKTIGGQALQEANKLTSISITTTNAVSVASSAFNYTTGVLRTLTVNGPAWTQANLDNLLSKHSGADGTTAATAGKTCTIYVDKSMGWDGVSEGKADWMPSALTGEEAKVKPKKCFGVYVTANGARKAWLVNTARPRSVWLILR